MWFHRTLGSTNRSDIHLEERTVEEMTFKKKQTHYKKIRRSNYLASLRLAGFDTSPEDAEKELHTREAVLAKYRKTPI